MLVVILVDYREIKVVTDGLKQNVGDQKKGFYKTCTQLL